MAADEQEQSIEELLSGPKDSVMMFAGRQESSSVSPSRFQLASAGVFDDPLDLLLAHSLECGGKVEGNAGSSTDQFSQSISLLPSVRDLLSGPKDSVMMFSAKNTQCSQPKFHFDMSSHEDPLDVLVHEVKLRNCSHSQMAEARADDDVQASHAQELARRCRNELSLFHKEQREWDEANRRQAIHRELDIFLDDAAKSEIMDSATTSDVIDLKEKLSLQEKEIETLNIHITEAERAKQDALYALDESQANEETTALELWLCRQQLENYEETVGAALQAEAASKAAEAACRAAMEEALNKLSMKDVAVDKTFLEVQQLRGERDALRALSAAELAELAETLMESLQRVQRAHQHRFEQRMDEQLCVVCLSDRKNVVLQPCNHLTMCENCFHKCSSTCPQCRCRVERHLVIYM